MKKVLAFLVGSALFVAAAPAFASVSINLTGGSVSVPQGGSFVEPGYSAFSTTDGNVTGGVNVVVPGTNTPGVFSVGYSVTDSALNSASASRTLTVTGGGSSMPFCSSPLAPGWNVALDGGGCGGTGHVLAAGHSIVVGGTDFGSATVYTCPEWYGAIGCWIK